ncbi:hypothetical protein WJX73_002784 [Symbiochloris irregularis]|uniref:Uncharacterized protein n=1 Tax=Symbiochloris irregularis TaxID=706552 RepID=A0AAW1NXY5_9CHLO
MVLALHGCACHPLNPAFVCADVQDTGVHVPELISQLELLNTEGRLEDYDPRPHGCVGVRVMLVVTLLGAFPFDHTANHTARHRRRELDLWDLQDKIFVVNPQGPHLSGVHPEAPQDGQGVQSHTKAS